MSFVSDIINVVGLDNLQGLVGVVLTVLVGKNSWDVYKSKDVVKKSDIHESNKAIKATVELIDSALSELKDKHVKESHEKINELESTLKLALSKIESLEQANEKLEESLSELSNIVIEKAPRISRAEIRRMKDKEKE